MKVKYNPQGEEAGDEDFAAFGIAFPKGKYVNVPDDSPNAQAFRENPHFQVQGQETPTVDAPTVPEPVREG